MTIRDPGWDRLRYFCDYCHTSRGPFKKDFRLYDYGFKRMNTLVCEKCEKEQEFTTEDFLTTPSFEFKAYEGLMRIIKEHSLPDDEGICYGVHFYDMAKVAFNKSYCFREYMKFFGITSASQIDKNLRPLWSFVYRFVSRQEPRITFDLGKEPDEFTIKWRRDAARHMIFDGKMIEDFERDEKKPIIRD